MAGHHPLAIYKDLDPDLFKVLMDIGAFSHASGAMPTKTKQLILMVLNAVNGLSEGVTATARKAMQEGATKEEVLEALRVAQYQCGVGCLYTAAGALREVLLPQE